MKKLYSFFMKPEEIIERIKDSFPDVPSAITPEEVERIMRPIGTISLDVQMHVRGLLRRIFPWEIASEIGNWMEADLAVNGVGLDQRKRIEFLLRDPCTCVLLYLPIVARATGKTLDPRLQALLTAEKDTKKE